jgi:ppGpp synthetase/RelA/SpoT-type nucleotidyltranferase
MDENLWNDICRDYENYANDLVSYMGVVSAGMETLLKDHDIHCSVRSRIKIRESYYSKLKRALSKKPETPNPLTDLLGIRIVVNFLEDVDKAARLIAKNFETIELENKAQGLSFREFSYDATHLLVAFPQGDTPPMIRGNQKAFEVQIRTTLQDAWAEVEHGLIYKSRIEYPSESVKRKMASLNAILSLSDSIFQEIRDYQKELLNNKDTRIRRMHEKASLINSEELGRVLGKKEEPENPVLKNSLESIILAALNKHSAGDYDEAIILYSDAIHEQPNEKVLSVLYNHRGMSYFMNSKYNEAANDFNYAVTHNPENYRAHTNRGIINQIFKRYDFAIRDFGRSLEINHSQPEVLMHLAQVYFDTARYVKSLEMVDEVLQRIPDLEQAKALKKKISKKLLG